MTPEEYCKLVNPAPENEEYKIKEFAKKQPTPAARLAIWHNRELHPPRRIDWQTIFTLDYAYRIKDFTILQQYAGGRHALAILIARTMLDDLKKQEEENYLHPWWA